MRIPALDNLSFTWKFLILSFGALISGMVTIGVWVSSAVEQTVINRTAAVTALYVDSFVSPVIEGLPTTGVLSPEQISALDRLITGTPLGEQVVSFKIWSPTGEILYSPNPELVGRTFATEPHLDEAFAGSVVSEMSDLSEEENEYERSKWESLIETYAPVRSEGSGEVFAVSEFYQLPGALRDEIRRAQIQGWLIVGAATLVLYLLLIGLVKQATATIQMQKSELMDKVGQLESTLADNQQLQARVSRAAARTTTLNERFLRRLSADIHDGPAQDVSLALLRVQGIADSHDGNGAGNPEDVARLRVALESALNDLRAISRGLRTPGVEDLTPEESARRAVAEHELMSGEPALFEAEGESSEGSPSVSITVYRVVQESLANSFKHAGAGSRKVHVSSDSSQVKVVVSDTGAGFVPAQASDGKTLGLIGMKERVELLGGTFTVTSQPGEGTVVEATLPLSFEVADA